MSEDRLQDIIGKFSDDLMQKVDGCLKAALGIAWAVTFEDRIDNRIGEILPMINWKYLGLVLGSASVCGGICSTCLQCIEWYVFGWPGSSSTLIWEELGGAFLGGLALGLVFGLITLLATSGLKRFLKPAEALAHWGVLLAIMPLVFYFAGDDSIANLSQLILMVIGYLTVGACSGAILMWTINSLLLRGRDRVGA